MEENCLHICGSLEDFVKCFNLIIALLLIVVPSLLMTPYGNFLKQWKVTLELEECVDVKFFNFSIFYKYLLLIIYLLDMGLEIENIIDPDTKIRKDVKLYNDYDFLTKIML